ncbi:uncharacterized protein PRCAT00003204001 [Priceomyces carsonii]|uniref:uncharacterized protein n=1 Tax=Priceomyces carsonii TaxID=28549 RepID=UPI002EDA6B2F|nr:unnamed protein product [Priceomyces carsonii]
MPRRSLKNGPSSRGARNGRYTSNNRRKRKSKGTSNNHRGLRTTGINVPELMDLDDNVYIPRASGGKNTMLELSKRPGRLVDEVAYTSSHQDNIFSRKLRDRPVEFVKAKEIYNPNDELLKNLKSANEKAETIEPGESKQGSEAGSEECSSGDSTGSSSALNTLEDEKKRIADDLVSIEKLSIGSKFDTDADISSDASESSFSEDASGHVEYESDGDSIQLEEEDVPVLDEVLDKDEQEDSDNVNKSNDDPEYGFLSEDYEFDVSSLTVSNIRYGIQNQYYVKNAELFGDDFTWMDEDDLFEFVTAKGVREHRFDSFLKFMTRDFINSGAEESNDSDVYISDSSDDDLSLNDNQKCIDDDIGDEDDGIEDLINFTKNLKFGSSEYEPPTQTMTMIGSGRNKRLDLDRLDLDDEIRESLQEQFQIRRQSKKTKKKDHENLIIQEGLLSNDLCVKYQYQLHIRDIKYELDSFLHDSARDFVSFPPLDPHGNKTVSKMADYFNLKSLKCGRGTKQFIRVTKTKRTFRYLPNYDQIGRILRQRPIFKRRDQEQPIMPGNKKDRNKKSTTVLKDGDIVGANAPEIDPTNIGRQLLEKLGWVKGEGLGALGNKGISVPLTAKVKKSKSGLG